MNEISAPKNIENTIANPMEIPSKLKKYKSNLIKSELRFEKIKKVETSKVRKMK
tara:strand:- start:562 stop:723 length:162 start_codon:yes stop_codon:yes gene_type:complete